MDRLDVIRKVAQGSRTADMEEAGQIQTRHWLAEHRNELIPSWRREAYLWALHVLYQGERSRRAAGLLDMHRCGYSYCPNQNFRKERAKYKQEVMRIKAILETK